MKVGKQFVMMLIVAAVMFGMSSSAMATSQWARKYGQSCVTCHTAFPRLNYYGERFMRNGYQLPDAPADGNTKGKKALNEITFIDALRNHFGVRLNVTPLQWSANDLTDGGKKEDQWTIGNANWVQFFVAGSIAEDISIFIEMAWDDEHFHYSWYKLGFHNLFDTSMANIIVGNVPARDYGFYPNRLRIMGPVKADVFAVKSSQGANSSGNDEAALNSSGSRPAIQYYGSAGPIVVWAGVSPGDNGNSKNLGQEKNDEQHYWLGLRAEVTEDMESDFEGSGVSVWGYQGTDTANFAGGDVDADGVLDPTFKNDYTRYSVEGAVRYKNFEVMAVYVQGNDDNWNLDATGMEIDFDGISVASGLMTTLASGRLVHYSIQYDKVSSSDVASLEKEYVTPSVSYFPVENVRLGLYARIDTENSGDDADNTVFANVRTMF